MSTQRLARGMKLLWNGFEFKIEERLSNGQLRLCNRTNEERRLIDEICLIEAHSDGNLKLLGFNNENQELEERLQKNRVLDFTALDEDDPRKISSLKKLSYLKRLSAERKNKFSDEEIDHIIKKVSEEINDLCPPSTRNVRRWKQSYETSGEDIRVLADADKAKGNRQRKFSSDPSINLEVIQIIDESINEIYLTRQQNPVQAVQENIEYKINKINETRSEGFKLPIPHPSSVYRIVSQLDEYKVDKARKGERYANEKYKTLQKGPEPKRPLERVECDDTKTDLLVIDPETSLALGRPWLMVLICVFTKMILGYYLSFYPPSHVTVMMAMKHAIRPKRYVKEKYPDINNTWDTYGLIEVLVVDNAKHWYGKGLEDAFHQTGTDIQYAPIRIPWYKGAIERLLKTIHDCLIHRQPGTTFSNIFDKGDYDSEKHAVIYLDLLDEILHKWIIDIYSQDIHTGINDIPAERWKNSIVDSPPALPSPHTNLDIIFGKVEYRTISGTVINFKNLQYSHSDLVKISANLKTDERVKIKYDPTNLGMIYVYDAFWSCFIPVPAVDQEYAQGLTEWQHEVICKFIRRTNKARVNRKALIEAKEYIRRKIADAFGKRPRKLSAAGKIARWMEFEDPSEIRIIPISDKESSGNESDANVDSPSQEPKQLKGKIQFVPSNETEPDLEWSENEKWEAIHSNSAKEDYE